MKSKARKMVWLISLLTIVLAVSAGVCWNLDVFGKFVPVEPYVAQDEEGNDVNPQSAQVVVTSEGSNQKGKDGSGKEPCSEEVPTCEGKKGTKSNPFVVLEIVPSHAQQQLCYLAGDKETGLPFDPLEFGKKVINSDKSYASGEAPAVLGIPNNTKVQWLTQTPYQVHKIGSKEEMQTIHLAEVGKYYSLQYTEKEIKEIAKENGKNPEEEFQKFVNAYNYGNGKVEDIANVCPYLFEKDTTSEANSLKPEVLQDDKNWKKRNAKAGYLVLTERGKGDFGFSGYYINPNPEEKDRRWVYSYKKPENGSDFINDLGMQLYQLTEIQNEDTDKYNGNYVSLNDCAGLSSNNCFEEEEKYYFDYYGLKFNDVLKRSLFSFSDEKEYEDFHMKVICMTPKELNDISAKDGDDTLDMIERADMFFVQSGFYHDGSQIGLIQGTQQLYEFYHKFVKGNTDYTYEEKDAKTFFDNDLEWSSVMKIMKRVSENRNLPLMLNKPLGTMFNAGEQNAEACMHITDEKTYEHKKSCINNIAKLYLITTQFDLLARKEEGFQATFMEDIYPNLMQIELYKDNIHTAKMTGYYNRKEPFGCDNSGHETEKYKNRANYLWNSCTFYPETVPWTNSGGAFTSGAENTNALVSLGFFESYLTSVNSNPFMNDMHQQASGANTDDLDKNVTVIGVHVADYNESTLLHPDRTSDTVVNDYMGIVAYTILNSQVEDIYDLTLSVLKQKREYVKLSEHAVLVDYVSDKKYTDEKSYLKVNINTNGNNLPGMVKSVVLKKENGDKKKLTMYQKPATENADDLCKTITFYIGDKEVTGYEVDGSLIAYIPYSLKDWADGYNIMEFEMVGRIYSERSKKIKVGKPSKTEVTISERTLFNLE